VGLDGPDVLNGPIGFMQVSDVVGNLPGPQHRYPRETVAQPLAAILVGWERECLPLLPKCDAVTSLAPQRNGRHGQVGSRGSLGRPTERNLL
jgi:hypothetical protein